MRIDLEKVISEGGNLAATLSVGTLAWEGGAALEPPPFRLRGRLQKVRKGVEMEASLEGDLQLECVRCLEPFSLPFSFDFHLLFVPGEGPRRTGEHRIQQAEWDSYPCADNKVDLTAVAKEQIYLHFPLKPVCKESCRGLCAACGENLNSGACRCGQLARVRVI